MITLIAIPSVAAIAGMVWWFFRAPVSNELPQAEREGRRGGENERQRLERISKLPR